MLRYWPTTSSILLFNISSLMFCYWPTTSSIRLLNIASSPEIYSCFLRLLFLEVFDGFLCSEPLSLSKSIEFFVFLDFFLFESSFNLLCLLGYTATSMSSSSSSVMIMIDFFVDFLFLDLDFLPRLFPEDEP